MELLKVQQKSRRDGRFEDDKSFLKNVRDNVKGIWKKAGECIDTDNYRGWKIASQVGGNITDYATGVTDKLDVGEGIGDAFVYGAGGGAQFGGVTAGSSVYRAGQKAIENKKLNAFEQELAKVSEATKAIAVPTQETILENIVNPVLPQDFDARSNEGFVVHA